MHLKFPFVHLTLLDSVRSPEEEYDILLKTFSEREGVDTDER